MPVLGTFNQDDHSEVEKLRNVIHLIGHGYRAHYYISTPLLDEILCYLGVGEGPRPDMLALQTKLAGEMRRAHQHQPGAGIPLADSPEKSARSTTPAQRTLNQQLWDEMERKDEELLRRLAGEEGEKGESTNGDSEEPIS